MNSALYRISILSLHSLEILFDSCTTYDILDTLTFHFFASFQIINFLCFPQNFGEATFQNSNELFYATTLHQTHILDFAHLTQKHHWEKFVFFCNHYRLSNMHDFCILCHHSWRNITHYRDKIKVNTNHRDHSIRPQIFISMNSETKNSTQCFHVINKTQICNRLPSRFTNTETLCLTLTVICPKTIYLVVRLCIFSLV